MTRPGYRTSEAGAWGVAFTVTALVAAMPDPSWKHVTLALGSLAGAAIYQGYRTRLKRGEASSSRQRQAPPAAPPSDP